MATRIELIVRLLEEAMKHQFIMPKQTYRLLDEAHGYALELQDDLRE